MKAKVSATLAKLGMVKVVAPIVWEVKATVTSWPLVKSSGEAAEVAREVAEATPKVGVTKVGEVEKTKLVLVVPVDPAAVNPVILLKAVIEAEEALVPPLATGRTPVTPVVSGSPVTLVRTPEAGVPRAGATNVLLLKV